MKEKQCTKCKECIYYDECQYRLSPGIIISCKLFVIKNNKKEYERWAWVKGYEGKYQVSDYGRIKSFYHSKGKRETPIIVKLISAKNGYLSAMFSLSGVEKRLRVARFVAMAFIPNPLNKPQVNHKDGNKKNNHYANLEWVTPSENILHAYKTHLHISIPSEKHYKAKLTWDDVNTIRQMYKPKVAGFGCGSIAKMYGLTKSNISAIVKGKTWDENSIANSNGKGAIYLKQRKSAENGKSVA